MVGVTSRDRPAPGRHYSSVEMWWAAPCGGARPPTGEGTHQVRLDEGRGSSELSLWDSAAWTTASAPATASTRSASQQYRSSDGQARGEKLGRNVSQGTEVARIGEFIEDDDVDIRMILKERV